MRRLGSGFGRYRIEVIQIIETVMPGEEIREMDDRCGTIIVQSMLYIRIMSILGSFGFITLLID